MQTLEGVKEQEAELDTSGQDAQKSEPEKQEQETSDNTLEDGDEIIDLGDEKEQVLADMKKSLENGDETELAFQIADRYISIQEVDGGYDYSIMGADYKEIDGGVYDNPDMINSMLYLIAARKREFGILRAMGITDSGFRKMIAKEGLRYGIYSGITVLIVYFIVQKILYYFMVHVYLYLHPRPLISCEVLVTVLVLNIGICVSITLLSGETILKKQIIEEI